MEARVPDEQRLSSNLDLATISQRPVRPSCPIDDALRNGQQIFYIGLWHIRSKIHRGLLYKKRETSGKTCQVNVDPHRDIVRRCSTCLLHLYRHTKLPTAFISAIAGAALTLSLELIDQPSHPYNREIRTIVIECFSRLQTNSSPIIGRACQVLEYFLGPVLPHTGISSKFSAGLNEWHEIDPCVIISEDSPESTANSNLSCINGVPELQVPVNDEKPSTPDDSSGSVIQVEVEKALASNDQYIDSSSQPMIGLTNPLPQVTSHDFLTFVDQGTAFQYQDDLQEPWIEQSHGSGFISYSNDIQDPSGHIKTPSFQRESSTSSNYPPFMTHIGCYQTLEALPVATISNSMVYSNHVKGEGYSTIEPTKSLQPRGSWQEEVYYYGLDNLGGRVIEPEVSIDPARNGDLSFVVDPHRDSGPIINGNYSIGETAIIQNHRNT